MARGHRFFIALLPSVLTIGLFASTASWAQTRCRCSSSEWVGKCTATISQERNWITVRTNTRQCARVDWYADEHPRLTIVVDGSDTEEWLGPTPRPRLTISDCNVCLDAEAARGAAPGAGKPAAAEERIAGRWDCITRGSSPFGGGTSEWWITFTAQGGGVYVGAAQDPRGGDPDNYRATFDAQSGTLHFDKKSWTENLGTWRVRGSTMNGRQSHGLGIAEEYECRRAGN
jgi:hypothetical protein